MLKLRVGVLEQHNIVRHGLYKHLSRQSVLCLSEFFNFADMFIRTVVEGVEIRIGRR